LKLLEDRYGFTIQTAQDVDPDEAQDLLAALLELRGQMRKLQWYGEVNRRGFIKITKKLDKKIPIANAQKKYLELKVDPAPFATNAELLKSLSKVNDWISILTEVSSASKADDNASIASGSLKRTISRPSLDFSPEHLAALETYLRSDDADKLENFVKDAQKGLPKGSEPAFQSFLKTLLHKAISTGGQKCTATLLKNVVFLDEPDDLNRRNCIHKLVVSICRAHTTAEQEAAGADLLDLDEDGPAYITPAASPAKTFKRAVPHEDKHAKPLSRDDERIQFLAFLLDSLQPTQRSGLMARDSAGRTPLHFAAEFGARALCEVIVEHLQSWKLFDVSQGIDGPIWQDEEGWAPLHLSVIGGHPRTTQYLLDTERAKAAGTTASVRRSSPKSSAVLALAVKSNFIEVVRILVSAGIDINYQDDQGETALHVAARLGHDDCARLLLSGSDTQVADTELAETTYSWTPLFIACVDGHFPIVELLLDANADVDRVDSSGWTPKEHAALRGHVDIAARLDELAPSTDQSSPATSASTSPPVSTSLNDRRSNGLGAITPATRVTEPVKTFGHRYLTDQSMILVSLGSMDARRQLRPVNLDRIPLANAHSTQLDTALSIVVSAKGADGEPEVFDLPVQDNVSTEPIVFQAAEPDKVKVYFDLIPTYSGSRDRVVGRGVALLSSLKTNLGAKKMPLKGDLTIPIVAQADMEVIGTVTFNYLIINPFKHPNMALSENKTYWKSMASTMVIGHRGLGKNFAAGRRSLQLGENTIQSFIAAANLGASYVEFDVQLTKDHVPVIYHDFLVSETGIDAPVHTLTLEQFLHVNDMRTPRHSRPASPVAMDTGVKADPRKGSRLRSMSMGGSSENVDLDERMKHTRDFKKKGFKGNSRGNHIQAPFTTLEEMFRKLPKDTGFNIEMKYPMLFESEDEEMDTYAVELNQFVDTVLKMVYDLGKGRNIIFSSFHPDICLLLSFKQPNIPVLFLTDAGDSDAGDIRASSLQEAIRFASRWNLLGLVSAAAPLVYAPRLVRVVKESGLVCVSYGVFNNDPDKVALQVKQGIDAVIVDSVLAIRRGLTGEVKTFTNGTSPGTPSLAQKLNGSTHSLELPKVTDPLSLDGDAAVGTAVSKVGVA
jgi:glycerophosphodiester phosphodiesterase